LYGGQQTGVEWENEKIKFLPKGDDVRRTGEKESIGEQPLSAYKVCTVGLLTLDNKTDSLYRNVRK
jgi:hypothetical protein